MGKYSVYYFNPGKIYLDGTEHVTISHRSAEECAYEYASAMPGKDIIIARGSTVVAIIRNVCGFFAYRDLETERRVKFN